MDWRISRALADRLAAEAANSPDVEVCGLLLGDSGQVRETLQCRNVADRPADRFEIDPAALIAAHKAARAGADPIIGCYHSHPNGRETPSPHDTEAEVEGLWIVIANGGLHGWQWRKNGGFGPVALHID